MHLYSQSWLYHSLLSVIVVVAINSKIIEYHNPLFRHNDVGLHNSSSFNQSHVLNRSNRCLFYPRCLLFDCCPDQLFSHVNDYFHSQQHHKFPSYDCHRHLHAVKKQDASSVCDYDEDFQQRLNRLSILNTTITNDDLEKGLIALPPVHPKVLSSIQHRKEFKILYLAQGEDASLLTDQFKTLYHDLIFLSYKNRSQGCLYYPESNFATGRVISSI